MGWGESLSLLPFFQGDSELVGGEAGLKDKPVELKSSRPQASFELTSFYFTGTLGLHPISYKKGIYKWHLTSAL